MEPGISLIWTVELSVSVDLIDDQHKELIDLLAALYDSVAQADLATARQQLDDFISYTEMHFAEEEELMRACQYPRLVEHEMRHESLLEEVEQLRKSVEAGKLPISLALIGYLQVWLFEHIRTADRRLGEYLNSLH